MKNFKYVLTFLFIGLGLVSCEDYFGADSNVDPDNPIAVTENVILSQVQARLAYTYGGDVSRYISINTQHIDGLNRQFSVIGKYGILGNDVDQTWANIYTGTLQSNRRLIQQAQANGFNHFAGVGMALEAFGMMVATDVWGDIPYSDAFRFDEVAVYSPTFDAQQAIYDNLFTLLDNARTALLGDDGGLPLSGDLIYGGDVSLWIKMCNVLEARGRLHLSKVNSTAAYTAVLSALNKGGFVNASESFDFKYGTAAVENAPWFQYIQQRDDCEVGVAYIEILTSLNDPRVDTYGAPHDANHPIFTIDRNQPMMTYTEQLFIRAEAELMTGNSTAAYDSYLAGIESSFADAGVTGYDEYIAQTNVGVGDGNLSLNNVITQKYIALLADPEVFNDWRRTDFPALTPIVGSAIPRRLPYAQSEVDSNDKLSPSESGFIFTPVWWDQ